MKTPDRHIPTYSAELFTWYGFAESGSAEAFDLRLKAGEQPGEQVWDDSLDVGFFVQGKREKRLYTILTKTRRDTGDVVAWELADVDRPENKIFVYRWRRPGENKRSRVL